MSKTPEEIAELKRQWIEDPCWDIEDITGFEVHRDELRQYREQIEADYEVRRSQEIEAKAVAIGCPGNRALAEYVMGLEAKIEAMADRIAELWMRV